MDKITVRKLRHGEEKRLFEIFELCVGKQWTSYLEIDQGNYLDRIFGPAYIEEYRGVLSRLATKKDILVAECKGELLGYAIPRAVRLFHADYALHLYVPISKDFDDVCRALLLRAFRPSSYIRKNQFRFIYIGNETSRDHLRKLGFEVTEFLVALHFT